MWVWQSKIWTLGKLFISASEHFMSHVESFWVFRVIYLWEGEAAARTLVVFIGALKLQVLPPNPPQHSGQLLLQLQFPGTHKKKEGKPGGETSRGQRTEEQWGGASAGVGAVPGSCFKNLMLEAQHGEPSLNSTQGNQPKTIIPLLCLKVHDSDLLPWLTRVFCKLQDED